MGAANSASRGLTATSSCRDDNRPDSDRPEWRHGGVSDRSGGRSSVAGADPASDEPNELEWLHWVASRVAAEGGAALAAAGCPPELWEAFQQHLVRALPDVWQHAAAFP